MNVGRIARNISSQWLALAAQMLISVLMTPFMVRHLGDTGYGIITVVSGLVGYSGVLYMGLGAAIVKYVAQHHARGEQDQLNETVSTIFTVYLAIGALCLAITLALAYPLPFLLHIPRAEANAARAMLLMMGVALLVQFPGSVYSGVLMGLQKFDTMNTYGFVLMLARTVAMVSAVYLYPSVLVVGAITMASFVIEQGAAYRFARREMPDLRCSPALFRRARLRQLFTFSTQSFLFTLSEKLINYTDEIVISQALGPAAVTSYVIPLRLVDYARDGMDKATMVLMPGVSATAAGEGGTATLKAFWRTGNKAVMMLVAPVALVFVVWGRDLLALWLDADHATRGYASLVLLALAFVVQVMGRGLARPIFEGLGELTVPARITVAEGVTNFVLSVWLVRTWGIAGVAFATLLPATVTGVFVMPWFVCRRLGTSYPKHLLNAYIRALPPLAPAWGVLWLAHRAGLHRHFATAGLTCFAVLLVYVAGATFGMFNASEREVVFGPVLRRLGRRPPAPPAA